jgi:hypothetical protein
MSGPTRDDILRALRENPQYREALGRARTPEERKNIARLVEGFAGNFAPLLQQVSDAVDSDPEFPIKLGRALADQQDVLKAASQTPVSGSI